MAHKLSEEEEVTTKLLLCGSCKDAFDDKDQHPRVLPCLHTLCFLCLQTFYQTDRVVCPCCYECHTLHYTDWREFPRDYALKDARTLLQILQGRWPQKCEMCARISPVSYRCKECEIYICDDCVSIHKRVRKLMHHELFPINENQEGKFLMNNLDKICTEVSCTEHISEREILRIYCKSCRKSICSACAVERHQGHIFSPLSRVHMEEKEKSYILHSQVDSVISAIQDAMECLTLEREEMKLQANYHRNAIKATFSTAQDILQKKQEELEGEIDTFCTQKSKILHGQAESMKILKHSCKEACLFFEHSLLYNNKPAFLEISQSILGRFIELYKTSFDTYPHTSATSFRCIKTGEMLSFQEVVNLLVSITNTEGNIHQCQFSCPSQCFLYEGCQLSIMLVSSYGQVISDESVECLVTKDDDIQTAIKGMFSSTSKTYNFYWKSNETGIFTLTIYSNTVEIAKKDVHVMNAAKKTTDGRNSWQYLVELMIDTITYSNQFFGTRPREYEDKEFIENLLEDLEIEPWKFRHWVEDEQESEEWEENSLDERAEGSFTTSDSEISVISSAAKALLRRKLGTRPREYEDKEFIGNILEKLEWEFRYELEEDLEAAMSGVLEEEEKISYPEQNLKKFEPEDMVLFVNRGETLGGKSHQITEIESSKDVPDGTKKNYAAHDESFPLQSAPRRAQETDPVKFERYHLKEGDKSHTCTTVDDKTERREVVYREKNTRNEDSLSYSQQLGKKNASRQKKESVDFMTDDDVLTFLRSHRYEVHSITASSRGRKTIKDFKERGEKDEDRCCVL